MACDVVHEDHVMFITFSFPVAQAMKIVDGWDFGSAPAHGRTTGSAAAAEVGVVVAVVVVVAGRAGATFIVVVDNEMAVVVSFDFKCDDASIFPELRPIRNASAATIKSSTVTPITVRVFR
jgi:hypothetical protein